MWENSALKNLPIDPNEENIPRIVKNACFSRVKPTPIINPKLVIYSKEVLQLLDLDPAKVNLAEFFSGNKIFRVPREL